VADEDLIRTLLARRFLDPEDFASRPALPDPVSDTAGKPFGKYLVLRRIGEGGFSRVYLAVDPLLGRRVALKVLKPGTPEDAARFGREARMAAELRHPNLVPVYEVGQVGREPYLAMAYIDGAPLEPAGLERDLGILLKVARALGAAHAQGMIHRDVKPQNILVDRAGEPFLTDFGMAKRLDGGEGPLTQTGTLVGTPAFMSPEQGRGEFRTLGPQSDVFSLGATLYYLLTRRPPFLGETMLETVRKVIETEPTPARVLNPRVPPELEAILRKCMAKDPAARYATGSDFADDLERFLLRQPVRAARRRLAGLALAPGAVLVAVALVFALRPGEPPPPAPSGVREKPRLPSPPPPPEKEPQPAPAPPPPAPPAPEPPRETRPELPAIDAALGGRVRRDVLDQPAAYVRLFLTDAERRRAGDLLGAGRAGAEDQGFLARLDREVAPALERERRFLAAAAAGRQPDPRRVEAPDLVVLKGNRSHEGRVVRDLPESVQYVYKGQTLTQPRAEVESVVRGGGTEMEFHRRLEASSALRDFRALAEWCHEKRLEEQREYALYRILGLDPADAGARRELGFPLTGPLSTAVPAPRAAAISFEGKNYTPDGLRQELLDRGFVVVDGQWASPKPWTWRARANRSLSLGGDAAVQTFEEVRIDSAYDLDQMKVVQVKRSVAKFQYVGPVLPKGPAARAKGTATIDIEAPGPILECRVVAAGSVEEGRGSIEVSALVNGRPPGRLYRLASGARRDAADITPTVAGARKFTLVAEIETELAAGPDGRPRGFAFFLPGEAKDPDPLSIEGKVAEPRPDLTRLLPPK
jgi:hypothetical protein